MREIKLIIAGGREFNNQQIFQQGVNDCVADLLDLNTNTLAIVTGMARGADRMGYEFAMLNGLKVYEFVPKWQVNGVTDRSAGHKRNAEMGNFSDALLAFWDGQSRGTSHMIQYMQNLNRPVYVIRY